MVGATTGAIPTLAAARPTRTADDEFIAAARAVGGIGYVVKPRLAADLLPAVREANAHRPFVSASR